MKGTGRVQKRSRPVPFMTRLICGTGSTHDIIMRLLYYGTGSVKKPCHEGNRTGAKTEPTGSLMTSGSLHDTVAYLCHVKNRFS